MALLGAFGVRADPVLNHNFVVSLIDTSSALGAVGTIALSAVFDVALGGFTECSGLGMSMQVEEHREGGRNAGVLKFPSQVAWSNITLRKGVGAGTALWDWFYGFVDGTGKRRDGLILLMNELHVPNNVWYFRRGLPLKYTGPTLNAAHSQISIESMDIAHEGIWQVPFVGIAAAAVNIGVGAAI